MTRSARELHVAAHEALFKGQMAALVNRRDWELLREVARLAAQDAPVDLAFTDPSRYQLYRHAVTRFHMGGWSAMTPERIDTVSGLSKFNPASGKRQAAVRAFAEI